MRSKSSLEPWRRKIDRVNRALLALLNRRTGYAQAIGRIKKELRLPISDPAREKAILSALMRANTGPLDSRAVKAVFSVIIRETKRIERRTSCE